MMNDYQKNLYVQLMELTKEDAFYFQDFVLETSIFRIFNYRLASYTEFQKPGALECRGHMFEVDTDGNAVRLAALPMPKFFNLHENPSTIGLDLTRVDEILLKADGSLMSTYLHDNGAYLRIKSKGSLYSEQALAAMAWLENHPDFKDELYEATLNGYTVNMEWCSPVHRIVIGYMEPHLKVLNMRHRGDGSYRSWFDMRAMFGEETVIERLLVDDPVVFVASIPSMTNDIEGYVVKLGSQWVKIKTEKYLSLHHAKDSVTNPRRLFEAILDEGIDDLRSLFYTDVVAMKMIDEMQDFVNHKYNHMVALVEDFYEANKTLDRKDYAVKGQNAMDRMYFGLAMNKYLEKDPEYKSWMKKHFKDLGIKDTQADVGA